MTDCTHNWCMAGAWNGLDLGPVDSLEVEQLKCKLCECEQVKLLIDGATHPTGYGSEVTDDGMLVTVSFGKRASG